MAGHGKTAYQCIQCGYGSALHQWQCPGCKSWDTARATAYKETIMSRNKIISVVSLLVSLFCFNGLQATPVNINVADAHTLAVSLNGIGSSKAQAIVDFRTANGEFNSVSDLTMVKGIGERTILRNRDDLAVNAEQLKELINKQADKNLQTENSTK